MDQHPKRDAAKANVFKQSRRLITAILITVLLMLAFVVYKMITN